VALEVVHGRQRQPARGGEPLRGGHAHQQGPDEPGPLRDGHEVDVVESRAGAGQRVVDDVVDELEVMTGRDLGHDAAVAVVHALRRDDVGAHLPVPRGHRRAGVVAAGLERQDHSAKRRGRAESAG
jgi:hypothetical protein